MGCNSSKAGSRKFAIRMLPEMKVDLNKDPQREVKEFPYMEFRLTPIDYQKIIDQNENWIDTYFRPEKSSILDPNVPTPARIKEWETFTWKRPKDVYGKGNFCVFKNIGPSDIKQGACGDCYFLSSIASLAENPDRVKEIFLVQDVNKSGCYALKLYVNGEPHTIVVDDYFPFNERKNDWAFSRCSVEKEIWVLLLEKAWAKIHGSYQRIEAGTTGEALPALTGAPSEFQYHAEVKSQDEIWKKIRDADQRNYIIATAVSSARQGKSSEEMKKIGLVDAHAYSLISTHEEVDASGKPVRLIKIRNPWGFKEWTGDWSDKSAKWTPELKQKLSFEDKDDGVFFICYEDYMSFFYITSICKYIKENDLSIIADQHARSEYCVQKFTVPKNYDSAIIINVNQIHARFMDEGMLGQYTYGAIKLILTKMVTPIQSNGQKGSDELMFIDGQYICYQQANIILPKMTQGDYILFIKIEWEPKVHPVKRIVTNIDAPDPFEITRVHQSKFPESVFVEMDDFLAQRLDLGIDYELPVFSSDIEEYHREERLKIEKISFRTPKLEEDINQHSNHLSYILRMKFIQTYEEDQLGEQDKFFDFPCYFDLDQKSISYKLIFQTQDIKNSQNKEIVIDIQELDCKDQGNDNGQMQVTIENVDCPPFLLDLLLNNKDTFLDKESVLISRLHMDRNSVRHRFISQSIIDYI